MNPKTEKAREELLLLLLLLLLRLSHLWYFSYLHFILSADGGLAVSSVFSVPLSVQVFLSSPLSSPCAPSGAAWDALGHDARRIRQARHSQHHSCHWGTVNNINRQSKPLWQKWQSPAGIINMRSNFVALTCDDSICSICILLHPPH